MHSVLVYVPMPNVEKDWREFLFDVTEKTKGELGVLRLAENVWLLNLQTSLFALGHITVRAKARGFSLGVLPFERAPEWLPVGFDPTPI